MGIREFDFMVIPPKPHISLVRATFHDIERTAEMVKYHFGIGRLAPAHVIARIMKRNNDSVFIFIRNENIAGFWAMLMLNEEGKRGLLQGILDLHNPQNETMVPTGEQPTAIYVWATLAPGTAAEGVLHISEFLRSPLYRHVDLYSRPISTDLKRNGVYGFVPITCGTPGLFYYQRIGNRIGL